MGMGLGMKAEVKGRGVVHNGYIPGCLSCLSIKSALLVTLGDSLNYCDGVI